MDWDKLIIRLTPSDTKPKPLDSYDVWSSYQTIRDTTRAAVEWANSPEARRKELYVIKDGKR